MDSKKAPHFACDACRLGKRKCDAVKPQCARCQKQEKPCSYPIEEKKKRRKYWDEDYVASLESQVKTLLAALDAKSTCSAVATAPEKPAGPVVHDAELPATKVTDHVPSGEKPSGDWSFTPQQLKPHGPEARSFSAMEELSVMMWRTNIGDGVTIIADSETDKQIRVESSKQLSTQDFITPPPKVLLYCQDTELLHELANLFLDNINGEHQFTPYKSAEFLAGYPYQEFPHTFLHSAILATGAIYSNRANAIEISDTFAQFAESLIFGCFRQDPTVKVVQGLCMMSWRSLALGRDHFGWIFISMAAGLCVHLRLHVLALDEFEARSFQPKGEDIQTFWMFYLIDRTAISILGRNCALPWRRVNVPIFEVSSDPKTADLAQISFMWQCKLWFLHDEQMDQIFTARFEEMPAKQQVHLLVATHESLSRFFKSLDRRLQLRGQETNKHVLFFHLAYQMALLITLPPFLRCFAMAKEEPTVQDTTNPNYSILILRSLTSAATMTIRLVRIYHDAYAEQWKTSNPVVIHHLLSAAIVLLMNATSQSTSLKKQSARWLKICINLLLQLKGPWSDRTDKTIKVIRVLADRWGVLGVLPPQFSHPVEPSLSTAPGSDSWESPPIETMPAFPVMPTNQFPLNPYSIPSFGGTDLSAMGAMASYSNFDFSMPTTIHLGLEAQQSFEDIFADGGNGWLFGCQEELGLAFWGS